jgi:hypothetical protein
MAILDWSQCPAVESVPGKRSGAWVFRDTRTPVSVVFDNLEVGASIDEIMEWFHRIICRRFATPRGRRRFAISIWESCILPRWVEFLGTLIGGGYPRALPASAGLAVQSQLR